MNPSDYIALVVATSTVVGTIVGSVWYASGWFHKQFSSIRSMMFDRMELVEKNILSKLEYHEQHDDKRFEQVNNNIWELRLRQVVVENEGKTVGGQKDQSDRRHQSRTASAS